ncbi:MAG: HAMP domain-containing protein, partial [Acidobacteria bacterium]|nr:HAMP domain-containing protein [Acidobacteriota bacterium]NIM62684.1 HAMP domain-containing protein [Acidobacteriota bacterium]NIQ29377.1 HAMP domain-containing protein [Acidobacteriota bacterium]NIQ83976.1 HAMP domain-containing protein [Acidobacteriota bacterium]NIT10085.1 HAMP domain-containing protein [Acidobacteriota bacterium]
MIRRLFEGRRLESSFAIASGLLVVLVVGSALAVVRGRLENVLCKGMQARGYSIAQSIGAVSTPSLLAYNYVALETAARNAVEDPDLSYVVIHDKEGNLAGAAGTLVSDVERLPELPEELDGPKTREVHLTGPAGQAEPTFESIVPVLVEGSKKPWGYVRVGLSYDSKNAELRRLTLGMIITGVLLSLAGMSIGRFLARRIAAPLRKLADGTEALSYGDTSYRISVGGARELAELAAAFNRMMDRVAEKAKESTAFQKELERLNATLEEQVSARTRALEESEVQYRTLVEHSPDPILIVQNERVKFFSRAFQETFGLKAEDVEDPNFRLESLFAQDCQSVVAHRLRLWQHGKVLSPAMVTAYDSAGRARELELRGSRIDYLGQSATECLLVDMTETQRLREELEDTQRLRALGELSSGVAHDFNNLLGAILGRIQLLRTRGFPPDVDGDMAVIEKAAQDGRETVRRIQEFSRTRTDRPFEPLSLAEIIDDAVEITRGRWKTESERRNVKVQIAVECDKVPPILGSATELREVFTNLILNAADAMPQGGALTLRCFRRGSEIHAEVEDTGVGMTEEIRRHLFDPFFTTKGNSGTGLGMSVAYGIVCRHGGTIQVETALGTGTK